MVPRPSLPAGSYVGAVRTTPRTNTVGFDATRCTSSLSPFGSVVTTGLTALCRSSGFASAVLSHTGCTTGPFGTRSPKLSLTPDDRFDGGLNFVGSVVVGSSVATTAALAYTVRATALTSSGVIASISAA